MKFIISLLAVQLICSVSLASLFNWQISSPGEKVADSDVLESQRDSLSSANNLVAIRWKEPIVIPLAHDNSNAPSVFLVTQKGLSVTGSSYHVSALVRYENGQVASHIPVAIEQVLRYLPEDKKKGIDPPQT